MSGIKVPYVNFPLQHKALKTKLLAAVERVLDHGQFILGPEVEEFERKFSEYCSSKYAVGVDNGTNALSMALSALGIGPDDEVITPPNSFLASTSSIVALGAKPVFVDVRDDFNIDPELIEDAITDRTKAIMPVHLTGKPAEMDTILTVARDHGLMVVEDCAQAVGSRYRDRHVGTFGDAGCFSLHPLKTLGAIGDGGVVVTNDYDLAERLRRMRNHGLKNRDECEFWGRNARLDALQAAILIVKLKYVEGWIARRREIAQRYSRALEDAVNIPTCRNHEFSTYHTYIVQTEDRDRLKGYLQERGIETKVHYPIPLHRQQAARGSGLDDGRFPVCEEQVERILSLPIYPELEDWQVETVIESILEFHGN